MDLVTVTCTRDKLQMLLQAESICKFVEPTTHWVIINDPVVSVDHWQELLSPFYTKHNLKILSPKDFPISFGDNKGGWSRQQTYKFCVYKFINNDYLTLDSKNFFIKHCSTTFWNKILGSGSVTNFKNQPWTETINYYSNFLNTNNTFDHLSIVTPFVFHKTILDHIDNFDNFLDWFSKQQVIESEYLFYSFLCHKYGFFTKYSSKNLISETVKAKHNFESFEFFKNIYSLDSVKVAGLHHMFLENLTVDQQNSIMNWINDIGLTTNIFGKKYHI